MEIQKEVMFLSDKKERLVKSREVTWLFVTLFISKILFSDIGGYISRCGTAAYILTALNCLLTLAFFKLTLLLSGADTDLFKAAEETGIRGFKKIVGALLTVVFLSYAGVMMRVYTDVISSIVLPHGSDLKIMAFLVVVSVFVCYAGVGVLTSYSYGVGVVLVSALAAILVLNIPNYDYTNIFPVLGKGADTIASNAVNISAYADLLLLFVITPYLKDKGSAVGSGMRAILISGAVITVSAFAYIMSVEYPFSQSLTLPILEIAFDVNLDVIFQRAEGVFFFLWIFSGFVVIGAYLSFALMSFVKGFGLSDRRAPSSMFVLTAAAIALSIESSASASEGYRLFYNIFAFVSFLIPIAVFGIRRVKRILTHLIKQTR